MLILTRKKGQSVAIGNNVVLQIVEVRGESIRLGIAAPNDIRILRTELQPELLDQLAADDPNVFGQFATPRLKQLISR